MRFYIAALLLTISLDVALAQMNHFPDQKWKEVKTEHFTFRTQDVSPGSAKRYAEKVWQVCHRALPGLKEEYENNTFKTADGEQGSDYKPFRFTVYIVKEVYPFEAMLDKVAQKLGDRGAGYKEVCKKSKMMSDLKRRYLVFCLDQRQGDMDALLVHSVATSILAGHARMKGSHFFHTAGFGYYAEHLMFKKCRVHYLNFSDYYDKEGVTRGQILDDKSTWVRPVKKLVRKGELKPDIQQLYASTVAQLDPPRSGMLFALAHFMCHTDANVKKHHAYVSKLRAGTEPSLQLLLESYGYDSATAFNKALKGYIMSNQFR